MFLHLGPKEEGVFLIVCPREESNFDYKIRNLASYPLNDEGMENKRRILEAEEFFNGIDERRLVLDLFQYRLYVRPDLFHFFFGHEKDEWRMHTRAEIEHHVDPFHAIDFGTPALELFQ